MLKFGILMAVLLLCLKAAGFSGYLELFTYLMLENSVFCVFLASYLDLELD